MTCSGVDLDEIRLLDSLTLILWLCPEPSGIKRSVRCWRADLIWSSALIAWTRGELFPGFGRLSPLHWTRHGGWRRGERTVNPCCFCVDEQTEWKTALLHISVTHLPPLVESGLQSCDEPVLSEQALIKQDSKRFKLHVSVLHLRWEAFFWGWSSKSCLKEEESFHESEWFGTPASPSL